MRYPPALPKRLAASRLAPAPLAAAAAALAAALGALAAGPPAARASLERVEEVRFDPGALALEETGAGVAVRYPGAVSPPAGAPDLPQVPVWIEIPDGYRLAGVRGEPVEVITDINVNYTLAKSEPKPKK